MALLPSGHCLYGRDTISGSSELLQECSFPCPREEQRSPSIQNWLETHKGHRQFATAARFSPASGRRDWTSLEAPDRWAFPGERWRTHPSSQVIFNPMLLRKSKAEGNPLSRVRVKKQRGTPNALISTHVHGHHSCARTCVHAHTRTETKRQRASGTHWHKHTLTHTHYLLPLGPWPFQNSRPKSSFVAVYREQPENRSQLFAFWKIKTLPCFSHKNSNRVPRWK